MKKFILILMLTIILFIPNCASPSLVTFESKVVDMQFIVRGWNTPDLVQITFQDGHVLFVNKSKSFQFQKGHTYQVAATVDGDLRNAKEIPLTK